MYCYADGTAGGKIHVLQLTSSNTSDCVQVLEHCARAHARARSCCTPCDQLLKQDAYAGCGMAKQVMLCCAGKRRRPDIRMGVPRLDCETLRKAGWMQCAAPKQSDRQNISPRTPPNRWNGIAALDVRPGWDKHRLVQNPGRNVRDNNVPSTRDDNLRHSWC